MKTIKMTLVLVMILSVQTLFAQKSNEYYFSKIVTGSFEDVTAKVKSVLKEQGFGVITEIDMDKKLKESIDDVDLKPYKILGVCNPSFAWQTIQSEENIGLFLPCKVLVKELENEKIEVVMINPSATMSMLKNENLTEIADKVTKRFKKALKNL